MDIYTLIRHDHEAAKKLIDRINLLPASRAAERFSLFMLLKETLITQNEAEAGSFYAAIEQHPLLKEKMPLSRKEHVAIAEILEALSDSDMDPQAWTKLFDEFQILLFRHIEREEGEIFALARAVLSRPLSSHLASIMENLKHEKKGLLRKAG